MPNWPSLGQIHHAEQQKAGTGKAKECKKHQNKDSVTETACRGFGRARPFDDRTCTFSVRVWQNCIAEMENQWVCKVVHDVRRTPVSVHRPYQMDISRPTYTCMPIQYSTNFQPLEAKVGPSAKCNIYVCKAKLEERTFSKNARF